VWGSRVNVEDTENEREEMEWWQFQGIILNVLVSNIKQ
jgi:hypothetical protein